MEESNISQIINAGPVIQPPTITHRFRSSSGKLCSILIIEFYLFNFGFDQFYSQAKHYHLVVRVNHSSQGRAMEAIVLLVAKMERTLA
jgi:hypothetical protein